MTVQQYESLNIIKEYEKKDHRINIITKTNGGLVSATVAGVKKIEGNRVCFLDPDDYYGPNFVRNFMMEMDDDTDVVAAGFYQDNCGHYDPILLNNQYFFWEQPRKFKKHHFY